MKKTLLSLLLPCFFISHNSDAKNNISSYIISDSFSNILPLKQLIEDDWLQAPATDASIGFTQNEIGLSVNWHKVTFTVAHRLDYFVFTNADTAQAFYLERTDQALTTKDSYKIALKLHHQQSNGLRLGYQWQFDEFSAQIDLGYWQVTATRESQITGELFGDDNNNITGTAALTEFYTDKNFLKHTNDNNWQTKGYGLTVDLALAWQVNDQLAMSLNVKDLYSQFNMKGLGFNQGNIDTEGTFINSLGGKSYLPLYRGIFGPNDYQFSLPEQVNLLASYQGHSFNEATVNINYLARYKRQGEVNFYYAGVELAFSHSTLKLLLEVEHLSPEIQYGNQWLNVTLAIDDIDINQAMQFTLGVAVNYFF